ncbi:MAG: glycosyltransferase family 4 protein [Actinomycetes bacterium]
MVEQAIKNLETYRLLVPKTLGAAQVGMWGHGRSYSTPQSGLMSQGKQLLTRRTKWFFAYTQAGADHVVSEGFPRIRTTVLNNTVDTEALRSELDSVTEEEIARFRDELGIEAGKTALFIGGVDDAKGIAFLLESVPHIASLLPGFTLLIAGDGARRSDVQAAEAQGLPIRYLGRLEGREKARALLVSDVLAIPKGIGLVALDSLVAGRPIVSTTDPYHGPEYEFLEDHVTCLYSPYGVKTYADAMSSLLADRVRLSAMQNACLAKSKEFSIALMADRFLDGLLEWDEMRRFGL